MRTGIITFQDAENYGAALQALALKKTIEKYTNCDVINYYNEHFHRKRESNFINNLLLHSINKKLKIKSLNFKKFQNEYIVKDQEIIQKEYLEKLNGQYDIFITGSDQVFNLNCSGNDKTYFLDFVSDNNKKNSYAASFGSNKIEDINLYYNLLKDFKNLSIREESGQKLLKTILDKEVQVVLDPTLLLTKTEWSYYINPNTIEDIKKEKYILVYEVLNGNNIIEFAKKISKKYSLPIYCITSSNRPKFGMKTIRDAGPSEWLYYISNCEFLITNSFHGLAFSLIYNKQFWIELLPPPSQTNARMIEMLERFNLEERVIKNSYSINYNPVKFGYVNNKVQALKKISINYIEEIIK